MFPVDIPTNPLKAFFNIMNGMSGGERRDDGMDDFVSSTRNCGVDEMADADIPNSHWLRVYALCAVFFVNSLVDKRGIFLVPW